jgi:hypothetical protein
MGANQHSIRSPGNPIKMVDNAQAWQRQNHTSLSAFVEPT